LKLKYDNLLSSFALYFNLRRYTLVDFDNGRRLAVGQGPTPIHFSAQPKPFWSVSRWTSSL
jgi:hypothetical protein